MLKCTNPRPLNRLSCVLNFNIVFCFCAIAVSMLKMAHLQAAVLWIPRPHQVLAWFCTQTFPATTSGESPSSTAQTATMTFHQSQCLEILLSPQNCEYSRISHCCIVLVASFYLLKQLKTTI